MTTFHDTYGDEVRVEYNPRSGDPRIYVIIEDSEGADGSATASFTIDQAREVRDELSALLFDAVANLHTDVVGNVGRPVTEAVHPSVLRRRGREQ